MSVDSRVLVTLFYMRDDIVKLSRGCVCILYDFSLRKRDIKQESHLALKSPSSKGVLNLFKTIAVKIYSVAQFSHKYNFILLFYVRSIM